MMIDKKICVLGLGYVGLPLILELGKYFSVIGYDISKSRIFSLKKGIDYNREFKKKDFKNKKINFTNDINFIKNCNIYIIAVPTPVDSNNKPDVRLINQASKTVGKILKINDIVVYESTVYPGFTENISIKILEKNSKLKFNQDFSCGYSPERVNPGDKKHTIVNTVKLVSASNKKSLIVIKKIYNKIIKAGTKIVKDIQHAEAAKVIENIQRDINIALMNELKVLFTRMKIDTNEVLSAANTKWNFLKFTPGLVGGHCIGVDPYYLAYRAKEFNYKTKIIKTGRKINDQMSFFYNRQIYKLIKNNFNKKKINILILGATFKENVSDCRNSKVFDIYKFLKNKKMLVEIFDPKIPIKSIERRKYKFTSFLKNNYYDLIIIAVSHNYFKKIGLAKIKKLCKKNYIIYDIKNFLIKNKDFIKNV